MSYLKKEILAVKFKLEMKKTEHFNKTIGMQQKVIAAHLFEFIESHTGPLRNQMVVTTAEITDGLNRPQPSFIIVSDNKGKTILMLIINLFDSNKAFSFEADKKIVTFSLEDVEKFKLKVLDYIVESIILG